MPTFKLSDHADGFWDAKRKGIDIGSRVRLRTKSGLHTDDAFVAGMGQTGLTVRIGSRQSDLAWKDIIELRKIEFV